MTIFLAAVQREPIAASKQITVDSLLGNVFASYERIVGNHYNVSPRVVGAPDDSPLGKTRTLIWNRPEEEDPVAENDAWWAVSAGSPVASQIVSSLQLRAGKTVLNSPVWGAYATLAGDLQTGRVLAWNTSPALEAINYGVSDDYVFISNRPLLVALAQARGDVEAVRLSSDYLDEYLTYGFNVTEQTAFQDVKVLSADSMLIIHEGVLKNASLPDGNFIAFESDHSVTEAGHRLKSALSSAGKRTFDALGNRRVQLRMSGGKDSRTLLGLIKENEADAYAVTFGKPFDSETIISNELTSSVGIPLYMRAPERVGGSSLRDEIATTIAHSDGLAPAEPHTAIYRGSSPDSAGEGIMLGQWPLYKGGMARRFSYTDSGVATVLKNQGAWMVSENTRERTDDYINQWAARQDVNEPGEILYLFARQFRSGRWLQAHINLYDRTAQICYPIADSQVTAVSDALTMREKVSQEALYLALDELWPFANTVPLSNNGSWRFEAIGENREFAHATQQARQRELTEPVQASDLAVVELEETHRTFEYTTSAGLQLAGLIVDSPVSNYFRSKITGEMWDCIAKTASGEFTIPERSSRREFIKFLWRIYVAMVWFSGKWLHPENRDAQDSYSSKVTNE